MGKKYSFLTLKAFLTPFRDAYARCGSAAGELERGIFFVAFLMAAIDGAVTDDELRLVTEFMRTCSGVAPDGLRKDRDVAIRHAGYLAMMARIGDYTEEMRLDSFLAAVEAGLSKRFVNLGRDDLAYAFAFWTAMAMSDGDFSSIERQALEALKARFDHKRAVRKQTEIDNVKRIAAYASDYDKTIEQLAGRREPSLREDDHIGRAEELLRKFQMQGAAQ